MINKLNEQQNLEIYENWQKESVNFWQEIAKTRQKTQFRQIYLSTLKNIFILRASKFPNFAKVYFELNSVDKRQSIKIPPCTYN